MKWTLKLIFFSFYYLSVSEIWPDRLTRGVAFGGKNLIRGGLLYQYILECGKFNRN
jgi:hypothetical protein